MEKQESVLSLCLLYTIDHPANSWRRNGNLLVWLIEAVDFWCSAQRPNGSFDEWYPYENSMTATAFSTQCVTECILRTKDLLKWDERVFRHVERAASWIANHEELAVSNQEAGGILALGNTARLTGSPEFRRTAERKLERLLGLQNEEGWFPEYGGADVGYSSVTLAYLAQYWKYVDNNGALLVAMKRLVDFLGHFVHRDLSLGGLYGSRNTEYMLPLGPEILASQMPVAAHLAGRLRHALGRRSDVGIGNVDHRYLLFHNYFYLQAYVEAEEAPSLLPSEIGEEDFVLEEAGLVGKRRDHGHIVISTRKGGAFKIATLEGGLTDCGWTVVEGRQVWISSHLVGSSEVRILPDLVEVSGALNRVSSRPMSSLLLLLSRVAAITLGRTEVLGSLMKRIGRALFVTGNRGSSMRFLRRIHIDEEGVDVTDELTGALPGRPINLGGRFSYAIGPSTRGYRGEEMLDAPLRLDGRLSQGACTVTRRLSWAGKLLHLEINGEQCKS